MTAAVGEVGVDERWQEFGLCRQVDPELWFPEPGEYGVAAKRICRRCEPAIRRRCLAEGIENDEWGIWGGLSRDQRRRLKLKRREDNSTERGR